MFSWAIVICSSVLSITSLTGQVVDAHGQPVVNARVFIEPGLGGMVQETSVDESGTFSFAEVPAGDVGAFAIAPGMGFGGRHLKVAVVDEISPVTIALAPEGRIAGKVLNPKGKPLSKACITRVALLGEYKVGIPLSKLKAFGFDTPYTDEEGNFSLVGLPAGGAVALKVGHADYAQEGVREVQVGREDLRVQMYPGVLIRGDVLARDTAAPVAHVTIVMRNAQPPYDTAVTETDGRGAFMLRLKPGVYMYQATGTGRQSAGWTQLAVRGQLLEQRVKLYVAGTGYIYGVVKDAVTGAPVKDARLSIRSNGNLAALVRTGATGAYRVAVTEGESTVHLEFASGYTLPELNVFRASIAAGAEVEIPEMWLAPIPEFKVQVLDEDGNTPLAGAIVQLLRPQQLGWRCTDEEGRVTVSVAKLPEDGALVGMVEHPTKPLGALFALNSRQAHNAQVQVLPFSQVHGRVVDDKGASLEGAVVGGMFANEKVSDIVPLWRIVADRNGYFQWNYAIPGIPQRVVARTGENLAGESMDYNPKASAQTELGNVVVAGGVDAQSCLGNTLKWYTQPLLAGKLPEEVRKTSALLVYCSAAEAEMVQQALQTVKAVLEGADLSIAMIVHGAFSEVETKIPVLQGAPPAEATTYLLNAEGRVIMETFGLPPLQAVQALIQ